MTEVTRVAPSVPAAIGRSGGAEGFDDVSDIPASTRAACDEIVTRGARRQLTLILASFLGLFLLAPTVGAAFTFALGLGSVTAVAVWSESLVVERLRLLGISRGLARRIAHGGRVGGLQS